MLPLVRQLGALPAEEFDTVVRVGVVAGADDHAEAGPLGPGQIGNARGRQRTEQHHIDTRRIEARLERALEHVARNARVLADQHRGPLLRPLQYPADGMRQPQNEVGSDGRFAHRPADAVGAEIGSGHGWALVLLLSCIEIIALRTVSAASVCFTSCTRTTWAPRSTASSAA